LPQSKDDRPEISVVPLEPALIFRHEPLERMKKHPVENSPFRMTRTVDSRHFENEESKNAPGKGKGKNPGTTIRNGQKHALKSVENVNVIEGRHPKTPLKLLAIDISHPYAE